MNNTGRNRLGPFEIGELIGTGGFASVYRAYDERLQCDVAIKILADNHTLNPDVRERFIREAQALRQIHSPGVVSLYDIGETADGRPYLVMEFADRGGLMDRRRQRVNQGWQPDSGDIRYLVGALADALEPVHAEQLVHRDVTPANLLIRSVSGSASKTTGSLFAPDERLLVSDLGLVKDLLAGSGLTAGSGTAGFAAPEQQYELTTIDGRSDIYSATAVILWLIVGQSPRAIEDIEALLDQQGWPTLFVAALLRGLADEPAGRHGTIGEWKTDLLSALPLNESGSSPSGVTGSANDRGRHRLRPIGYAAVGLLACTGAAAAAVSLWPDDPTQANGDSLALIASSPADSESDSESESDSGPSQTEPVTTTVETTPALQVTAPVETNTTEQAPEPRPDLQHFFFTAADDRTVLMFIWGAQVVPSNVVHTDVAVSVDDGEWVIEKQPKHDSARDYKLYSTSTDTDERRPVTFDSDYKARVRWGLDDGTVTEWSRELRVAIPG